jgi:hypothetical protein
MVFALPWTHVPDKYRSWGLAGLQQCLPVSIRIILSNFTFKIMFKDLF